MNTISDTSLREKALRDGWLDVDERAVSGERILLLWAPFGGISEHVELGRFSQEKGGWVNTYGRPFQSAPDKYAPLAPFDASAVLDDKDRRIEALEAENEQRRKEQPYIYIGKGGKSVLARDLEDDRDRLKAEQDELRAVAIKAQAVLAMFVAPDAIKQTTVINAYAAAVEAEAELRAALSGKEGQS